MTSPYRPMPPDTWLEVMTFARLQATDPTLSVAVADGPTPSDRCDWEGCADAAVFVIHAWIGTNDEARYPLCQRHRVDFARAVAPMLLDGSFILLISEEMMADSAEGL